MPCTTGVADDAEWQRRWASRHEIIDAAAEHPHGLRLDWSLVLHIVILAAEGSGRGGCGRGQDRGHRQQVYLAGSSSEIAPVPPGHPTRPVRVFLSGHFRSLAA